MFKKQNAQVRDTKMALYKFKCMIPETQYDLLCPPIRKFLVLVERKPSPRYSCLETFGFPEILAYVGGTRLGDHSILT